MGVAQLSSEQQGGDGWLETAARLRASLHRAAVPHGPDTLVGGPSPLPAAEWHLRELDALNRAAPGDPAEPARQARRLYHERMLFHLIDPNETESRPLVSILIPVYNRADLLVEAVRSCLQQSWRPIEILVIDDGSDQDPSGALRELGAEVRLRRKPHGGVASARNLGLRLARGDFIHFLDSDDLLLPDAVARKVAAFAAIPDASLCFSMSTNQDLPGVSGPRIRVPDGSEHCATSDLLSAALSRCPFFVPTVMMPRWVMLSLPPFEEDLRRGEDSRYWFRLALAGGKAIGLNERLTIRRMVADGLSTPPHIGEQAIDIALRDLRDLLLTPTAWHKAGLAVARLAYKLTKATDASPHAAERIAACRETMTVIAGFGDGSQRDHLSPVPLLLELKSALERFLPRLGQQWPIWHGMQDLVSSALRSAAPLTARDIEYWATARSPIDGRMSIARLFRSVLKVSVDDPALPGRIDRVLRRAARCPSTQTVKRYRKLRRRLRSGRLAACLAWPSAYLWPLDR